MTKLCVWHRSKRRQGFRLCFNLPIIWRSMDGCSDELLRRLDRLSHSRFRARFGLRENHLKYIHEKSLDGVMGHARRFIRERLSPSNPSNDGSQTPMNGHPVFIAQHATATCCRSCLRRWHGIEKGIDLTESQIEWILQLIRAWLVRQLEPSRMGLEYERLEKQEGQQQGLFQDLV